MAKVDLKKSSVAFFDDDRVKEPGFYLLEGKAEEDENGVVHETNMKPGDRVYPAEKGFQTDPPEEEGGE